MSKKFEPKDHIRKVEYRRKDGSVLTREILDTGPRLAWFRSDHPIDEGWGIVTECVNLDESGAFYRAQILDPQGKIVAVGHRFVSSKDFGNYNEKAETQAIGRALGAAGYGALLALEPEPDEGEGEADLPDGNHVSERPAPPRKAFSTSPSTKGKTGLDMLLEETNAQLVAEKLPAHYTGRPHILGALKAIGYKLQNDKQLRKDLPDLVAQLMDRVRAEKADPLIAAALEMGGKVAEQMEGVKEQPPEEIAL